MRPLILNTAFRLGDTVYLKVRADEVPGMVTGLHVRPIGVSYSVTWCEGGESTHYDIELTAEFAPQYERFECDA